MDLLLRLWRHLSSRRRQQLPALAALMIVGAALEALSLGAVVPFLGALTAPDRILSRPLGAAAARLVGVDSASELVLPLAVLFGLAALGSAVIRIAVLWLNTKLAYSIGGEFSTEAYRRTLYQPYTVHVSRNSAVVLNTIRNKTKIAVSVLYQLLMLAGAAMATASVVAALLVVDARLTIVVGAMFGAFYLLLTRYSRRKLLENSRKSEEHETSSIKVLQEGLGGVRDVLLDSAQDVYTRKYELIDRALRSAQGNNVFIANFPRYALEAFVMVVVAAWAYAAARTSRTAALAEAMPLAAAFALGAQRLLPALQQVFAAWAVIVGNSEALSDVLDMLEQPLPEQRKRPSAPLPFKKEVRFESVRFRYAADQPWALDGVSLAVPKGARVGIAGETGSGKSTFVDLFMGLLEPTEGKLLVDGALPDLGAWRLGVAHVPQTIFLADASIAENIAFGQPVDLERVKKAARQARIAEFIESRPEGYDAFVGERGVRLSGGQRQRIGIARALYKQCSVLVLDEATSALDNETEELVMQTIDGLDRELTILIVAHRLTTLRRCDRIIELKAGKAVEHTSYERFIR